MFVVNIWVVMNFAIIFDIVLTVFFTLIILVPENLTIYGIIIYILKIKLKKYLNLQKMVRDTQNLTTL